MCVQGQPRGKFFRLSKLHAYNNLTDQNIKVDAFRIGMLFSKDSHWFFLSCQLSPCVDQNLFSIPISSAHLCKKDMRNIWDRTSIHKERVSVIYSTSVTAVHMTRDANEIREHWQTRTAKAGGTHARNLRYSYMLTDTAFAARPHWYTLGVLMMNKVLNWKKVINQVQRRYCRTPIILGTEAGSWDNHCQLEFPTTLFGIFPTGAIDRTTSSRVSILNIFEKLGIHWRSEARKTLNVKMGRKYDQWNSLWKLWWQTDITFTWATSYSDLLLLQSNTRYLLKQRDACGVVLLSSPILFHKGWRQLPICRSSHQFADLRKSAKKLHVTIVSLLSIEDFWGSQWTYIFPETTWHVFRGTTKELSKPVSHGQQLRLEQSSGPNSNFHPVRQSGSQLPATTLQEHSCLPIRKFESQKATPTVTSTVDL